MPEIKSGDSFPEDITFTYVPYTEEAEDFHVCGIPIAYNASKEWKTKKAVVFSLPGAFTPTCSARHLPSYIEKLQEIKKKGVDVVAVVAHNDAYVMDGWAKANGVKHNDILFLSDDKLKFAEAAGWLLPAGRLNRAALIVDHGKVTYAEIEPELQELKVSDADAILKQL